MGKGDIRTMGLLGSAWGVAGFLALLGFVILRLLPRALDTFSEPLAWYHWLGLAGATLFFGYVKGYRGFQRGLSRRVVSRAASLKTNVDLPKALLAPLYCMGFFGAGRRRQITMICLTVAMVGLILVLRHIDQPWRGIIDLGLVTAFAWGFISTIYHSLIS
jgi:hypothetical protein